MHDDVNLEWMIKYLSEVFDEVIPDILQNERGLEDQVFLWFWSYNVLLEQKINVY